ncbi:MAG TPA: M20/M25/M40 family metallo-hydrolase [Gammaproteobacteria bacterium]|nr:M20/M25/M40 family metallo-hydrolase [Gammaproteobacteria bacterium]
MVSDDLLRLLTDLVAFDTTSRRSNLDLIDYVQHYLRGHGVDSELIFDETRCKANLYATIGTTDSPGVMLSGHTDVVPVDGQDWHTDPFSLVSRDGCFYARGSADMKGFIACVLAQVPQMTRRPLRTPAHIALYWDRMATGAPAFAEALVNLDCLIAGEMLYGTHYVLIGRIQNVRLNEQGDPLIYVTRRYRALLPSERVKPDGVG